MGKVCEVFQSRNTLALYLLQCLLFMCVGYIFFHYSDLFSFDCSLREYRRCCFEKPVLYQTIGKGLITYFGLTSLLIFGYLINPLRLFYIADEGIHTERSCRKRNDDKRAAGGIYKEQRRTICRYD